MRAFDVGEFYPRRKNMAIATGADESGLAQALLEHTNPGDLIDLKIGLEWWVEEAELRKVGDYLVEKGIDVRMVEMKSRPWPNTMRIMFQRPSVSEGYGLHPFLWFAGVIAVIAGARIIGWTIDALAKGIAENIVPLAILGTIGGLAYLYIQRVVPRRV